MSGDFQTIREVVRNGEYLKANILRLYKYRNVLKEIQFWESIPQNYEKVNEKQKLIRNVQEEIDKRLRTSCKAVRNTILAVLIAPLQLFLVCFYMTDISLLPFFSHKNQCSQYRHKKNKKIRITRPTKQIF